MLAVPNSGDGAGTDEEPRAIEFYQFGNGVCRDPAALGDCLLTRGLSAGDKNREQGIAPADLGGIEGLRASVPTDLSL